MLFKSVYRHCVHKHLAKVSVDYIFLCFCQKLSGEIRWLPPTSLCQKSLARSRLSTNGGLSSVCPLWRSTAGSDGGVEELRMKGGRIITSQLYDTPQLLFLPCRRLPRRTRSGWPYWLCRTTGIADRTTSWAVEQELKALLLALKMTRASGQKRRLKSWLPTLVYRKPVPGSTLILILDLCYWFVASVHAHLLSSGTS